MGWTAGCGVVVLAVAAAACSSGGGQASSTTTHASAEAATVPATKPAPKTTISVPPYSFDNSVPPPKLIQTGTDYKAILQSLLDYTSWLTTSRPDAELTHTIAAPGSKISESFNHDLTVLAQHDRRETETFDGPSRLTLISTTPTVVSARLVQHLRLQTIVARDGAIIDQKTYSEPTTAYNLAMVKGTDGRWRLASIVLVA